MTLIEKESNIDDGLSEAKEDVLWAQIGTDLRRVKNGVIYPGHLVRLNESNCLLYQSSRKVHFLSPKMKSVHINKIVELRSGYKTDNFHKAMQHHGFKKKAPEETCFSVVFLDDSGVHKVIDFTASSQKIRDRWVRTLTTVIQTRKVEMIELSEKTWLMKQFKEADKNNNGLLSFSEIWKLLQLLHLQVTEDYAKVVFYDSDRLKKDRSLNMEEFLVFFRFLSDRPDLDFILRQFSSSGDIMWSAKELKRFLTEEQQFSNINEEDAEELIERFEGREKTKKDVRIGSAGLRRLLNSEWGSVLQYRHEKVFQDMDQPLASYFVNSSHNTYLTGIQFTGEASVEGYIMALLRGARVLELDLFDGDNGEPVISHKNTLITPVTLRHALQAIKDSAFKTSPYPVILTLENHVSYEQQNAMAKVFVQVLGDNLYVISRRAAGAIPSPNKLRRRFIIRGKGVQLDSTGGVSTLDPALEALIAMPIISVSATNMHDGVKTHPKYVSSSISESKVEKLYESGAPLIAYTSEHLVKTYPKGLRQDSSNMNPCRSWIFGVQSVAMNFQTAGEDLDLNSGMFRINGNCGYVLKPDILRSGKDPRHAQRPTMKLQIGILSAQYLPPPESGNDIIDPYVSVEIFGIPRDEWKVKTKTILDNGFNPSWNEEFEKNVYCPEVAMIRFQVKDYDKTSSNDFVGEFSLPLTSLRSGYSSIHLNTGHHHSADASASLFIRVAIDSLS